LSQRKKKHKREEIDITKKEGNGFETRVQED
jgi:hypothetical protein